jgi:SAM-dependent methyltransferase
VVECRCGLALPVADHVLSYEALLSPAALAAARAWGDLFRVAWDHGVKGDFDLREPVAPLLWWGILETAPQPAGERTGAHTVLAEHPLVRDRRRVLDIGCGPGASSLFLARRGHAVVAIDASRELTRLAKRHAMAAGTHVEYVCAELGTIRFRDESFDAAFALESLHHLPALRARMEEIHRLLAVGGVLAVDDHHRVNRWARAMARALRRWAEQGEVGALAVAAAQVAAIEARLAPHKCVSLGATLPEAARLFHIRHLDRRDTFLEAFAMAYHLCRKKSPESFDAAHEIAELLGRASAQAAPDWAGQVTFIGEKTRTAPRRRLRDGRHNPERSLLRRAAYLYWRGGPAAVLDNLRRRLGLAMGQPR